MRQRILFVILGMIILICAASAHAESISFEEAVEIVQLFNQQSADQLPASGWFLYRSVDYLPERPDGFAPIEDVRENWYFFNDRREVVHQLTYRIEKGGDRELIIANAGNFSLQLEDRLVIEGAAPEKPWFDLGFEFFLRNIFPGAGTIDIEISLDKLQDQELVLVESTFIPDRAYADVLGFADDYGSLRRIWFDPETGFALRSELYHLTEGGLAVFVGSVADVSFESVGALPGEIQRDFERTGDRYAAEWRGFTVIAE